MVPSPLLKKIEACGIFCFDTVMYQVSNSVTIETIQNIHFCNFFFGHLLAQKGRITAENILFNKKYSSYSSQTSILTQ